ncbi:MAG TPA: hypothetical protein H9755_08325 [Candidatus Dietzia intestinigallinarum]|nr:hypothetical protein [Candidatus Dietzia intestinigallinarum]
MGEPGFAADLWLVVRVTHPARRSLLLVVAQGVGLILPGLVLRDQPGAVVGVQRLHLLGDQPLTGCPMLSLGIVGRIPLTAQQDRGQQRGGVAGDGGEQTGTERADARCAVEIRVSAPSDRRLHRCICQ